MKRKITNSILALIAIAAITVLPGCYPIGGGGVVFYMCSSCVSTTALNVEVDDVEVGQLSGSYMVYCSPPCDYDGYGDYVTWKGKAGEHTFKIKNPNGAVVEQGVFEIKKMKCTDYQIHPSGCVSAGGGGGGGGGGNYSLVGTWSRNDNGLGCQGMTVYFNGNSGTVQYSPSGCCFPSGDVKWQNYNASSGSISDLVRNSSSCASGGYNSYSVYFSDANHVTIGSTSWTRL